jgi:glycine C-acetyltransferase
MTWLHDRTKDLLSRIDEAKAKRAFPFFREFENVGSRVKVGNGSFINFTSNDYLGLSQDKRLIQEAVEATEHYGTGLGSARPQATTKEHLELERRLAQWMGRQSCTVFTTGYQSIVGTISPFLDDDVTIILDRLNHASIMDAMLLGQGEHPDLEVRLFKHNNMKSLDKVLKSAANDKKMVVVEGLYSVDGDFGKLDDIVDLCKQHGAVLVVDDAHGLGTLGPTGRGVAEKFGVLDEIDLILGTFSKSFGGVGGFSLGDRELMDYIKLSARAFMFSASLPVSQVVAATKALDIIENEPEHRNRLRDNAQFFRDGLVELGFDLGQSHTHITPIMIRDEVKTLTFGAYLFYGGEIIMMPFVAPGVPPGTERLRCNVTSSHTRSEMGYALEALAKIGHMLEVIPVETRTPASDLQRGLWLAEHKLRGLRQGGLRFVAAELDRAREKFQQWQRGY